MQNNSCPFCQKALLSILETSNNEMPRGCKNSKCSSGFTDWGSGSYYFIRSYENPEDQYLPTELVVETSPDDGLTLIRIRFQAYLLADVDRIYDPHNPESLQELLKILDRIHKNLSLR